MIFHRCKCGKSECWESGFPPAPCQVCDECGSTLSWSPNFHRDPEPHEWKEEWIIDKGEPVKIKRCQRCYAKEPING